jgi:ubiquinone/menaquinone biosynthesis C-methylase UbiE
MASDRLETLRGIYDNRAPTYDQEDNFHAKQALDFLRWMSLKPGYRVLDLACGTGAISVPAAQAVGPSGKVFGVDISTKSLEIARAKAEKAGVQVKLFEHDISNIQALESQGIQEDHFDLITCASAFMLIPDPDSAVKSWAKLLKKGGRMIIDVPSGDSNVPALLMEKVAVQMGMEVIYKRKHLETMEKLQQPMLNAGLDVAGSFVVDHYDDPTELDINMAEDLLDHTLSKLLFTVRQSAFQSGSISFPSSPHLKYTKVEIVF